MDADLSVFKGIQMEVKENQLQAEYERLNNEYRSPDRAEQQNSQIQAELVVEDVHRTFFAPEEARLQHAVMEAQLLRRDVQAKESTIRALKSVEDATVMRLQSQAAVSIDELVHHPIDEINTLILQQARDKPQRSASPAWLEESLESVQTARVRAEEMELVALKQQQEGLEAMKSLTDGVRASMSRGRTQSPSRNLSCSPPRQGCSVSRSPVRNVQEAAGSSEAQCEESLLEEPRGPLSGRTEQELLADLSAAYKALEEQNLIAPEARPVQETSADSTNAEDDSTDAGANQPEAQQEERSLAELEAMRVQEEIRQAALMRESIWKQEDEERQAREAERLQRLLGLFEEGAVQPAEEKPAAAPQCPSQPEGVMSKLQALAPSVTSLQTLDTAGEEDKQWSGRERESLRSDMGNLLRQSEVTKQHELEKMSRMVHLQEEEYAKHRSQRMETMKARFAKIESKVDTFVVSTEKKTEGNP